MKYLLLGLAALVTAPAAAKPAAAVKATDYRANVMETSEGWTFGKPGAPLLTEYASFGCPHCGQFATATSARLDRLVKAGKLRFAFRPFLIFPHDRAAAVLARCVPPQRRLDFISAVLLGQANTKAKLAAADADEALRRRLYEAELAGPGPHTAAVGLLSGLGDLAAEHGLSPAKVGTCLVEQANHSWVTEADLTARLSGVTGTPTYYWKGSEVTLSTPEALLALLPR
jgi:protein-disulfide isomerase